MALHNDPTVLTIQTSGERLRELVGLRITEIERHTKRGHEELEKLVVEHARVEAFNKTSGGLVSEIADSNRKIGRLRTFIARIDHERVKLAWLVGSFEPTKKYDVSLNDLIALGVYATTDHVDDVLLRDY
jgi:hypothetical protein